MAEAPKFESSQGSEALQAALDSACAAIVTGPHFGDGFDVLLRRATLLLTQREPTLVVPEDTAGAMVKVLLAGLTDDTLSRSLRCDMGLLLSQLARYCHRHSPAHFFAKLRSSVDSWLDAGEKFMSSRDAGVEQDAMLSGFLTQYLDAVSLLAKGHLSTQQAALQHNFLHMAVPWLLRQHRDDVEQKGVATVAKTILRLCRAKPVPAGHILKYVVKLANMRLDESAQRDLLRTLAVITESEQCLTELLSKVNLIDEIVRPALQHSEVKVVHAAVSICGNIAMGNDKQTDLLLEHDLLAQLCRLLTELSPTEHARALKEVVWTLSNVGAGTERQGRALLQAGVPRAVANCVAGGRMSTQVLQECVWVLSNLADKPPAVQMLLAEQGAIEALCSLVESLQSSPKSVLVALEGLHSLLSLSQSELPCHPYSARVLLTGKCPLLRGLCSHKDTRVADLAASVCDMIVERPVWEPESHMKWPDDFRAAVRTLLLCHVTSATGAAPRHACGLGCLPHDVVLEVVRVLSADWPIPDLAARFGRGSNAGRDSSEAEDGGEEDQATVGGVSNAASFSFGAALSSTADALSLWQPDVQPSS